MKLVAPWSGALVFALFEFAACSLGTDVRLGGSHPASGSQGSIGTGGDAGGTQGGSGGAPGSSGGLGGASNGGLGGAASGGLGGADPTVVIVATAVRPITELNTEEKDDNPTLTSDELLICFTSKRPTSSGGTDIWCSERASRDDPFGEPVEQTSLNTEGFESSPSIGADGLSIWFGAEDDHVDVFMALRADRASPWDSPERVDALNSDEDDLPRPLALGGRVMPLSSRRDSPDYWTYLAERPSLTMPFGEPRLIEELAVAGRSFVDAFLFEDGLTMLLNVVEGDRKGDIHVATRPSLDALFTDSAPVTGVNTDDEERDPFISADGRRLYFSSDRDGELDLFVADIVIADL